MHWVAAHPLLWVGGTFCYSISCPPAIPTIWWGIQLWGLGRESSVSSAFPAWWGSLLFKVCFHLMMSALSQWLALKLVVLVWWLGIRLMSFTCIWSAEQSVAHSCIYPGFTGKVSSPNHFTQECVCEDYSFIDQAVADFEKGLNSILTDSINTPELDTSLDEPDAITSSVSSGFLHSVSTISDTSKSELAPSVWSCKLWCQARPFLAPVPLATRMSASKLIHYFSSYPAAFGLWFSTPPNNITLTPANRNCWLECIRNSDWHWCCCSCHSWHGAAHFSCLELPLLILFPLYQICSEELFLYQNAWITYQGSWHSGQSCVQMSWELSLYVSTFLILLPGSIVRYGLLSSPFFMILRVWFLLVRHACMAL